MDRGLLHQAPSSNWHEVWRWDSLRLGDVVEVREAYSHTYFAYVDVMTEDGSVIWLIEDGTRTRRLYLTGDVRLYRPKTARLVSFGR